MNIVITGGNSGLGHCLVQKFGLGSFRNNIFDLSLENDNTSDDVAHRIRCDVKSKNSVNSARAKICEKINMGGIDILINCAGINDIDYLENFDEERWDNIMGVNAKGIYLMSRAFLNHLKARSGTILNIISNASHMPMTNSLAYNASKGAAHIMTLQLARELKPRHNIDVFGISPNKMFGTGMSEFLDGRVPEVRGWTKEQAKEYQVKNLPAGEETNPAVVAEFIYFLLKEKINHKYLTGCIVPYGA